MLTSRHLKITNLNKNCTDTDIHNLFKKFGLIENLENIHYNGFKNYIISFMDVKSANRAFVSDIFFHGSKVKMEYCDSSGKVGLQLIEKNHHLDPLKGLKNHNLMYEKDNRLQNNGTNDQENIMEKRQSLANFTLGSDNNNSNFPTDYRGLKISRLPYQKTEDQIRQGLTAEFRRFGRIASILVHHDNIPAINGNRTAILTFRRREDAARAFLSTRSGEKVIFATRVMIEPHFGLPTVDSQDCSSSSSSSQSTSSSSSSSSSASPLTGYNSPNNLHNDNSTSTNPLETTSTAKTTTSTNRRYGYEDQFLTTPKTTIHGHKNNNNGQLPSVNNQNNFNNNSPSNNCGLGSLTRTLYIAGLTRTSQGYVTKDQLATAFRKFGEIEHVQMKLESNSAFVQFSEMRGPLRAMTAHSRDPLKLGGRLLKLAYVPSIPTMNIWIADLPPQLNQLTDSGLYKKFQSISPISEIVLIYRNAEGVSNTSTPKQTAAFIKLPSIGDASNLLKGLRNKDNLSKFINSSSDDRKVRTLSIDYAGKRQCNMVSNLKSLSIDTPFKSSNLNQSRSQNQIRIIKDNDFLPTETKNPAVNPTSTKKSSLLSKQQNTEKTNEDSRWEAASRCKLQNPIIKTMSSINQIRKPSPSQPSNLKLSESSSASNNSSDSDTSIIDNKTRKKSKFSNTKKKASRSASVSSNNSASSSASHLETTDPLVKASKKQFTSSSPSPPQKEKPKTIQSKQLSLYPSFNVMKKNLFQLKEELNNARSSIQSITQTNPDSVTVKRKKEKFSELSENYESMYDKIKRRNKTEKAEKLAKKKQKKLKNRKKSPEPKLVRRSLGVSFPVKTDSYLKKSGLDGISSLSASESSDTDTATDKKRPRRIDSIFSSEISDNEQQISNSMKSLKKKPEVKPRKLFAQSSSDCNDEVPVAKKDKINRKRIHDSRETTNHKSKKHKKQKLSSVSSSGLLRKSVSNNKLASMHTNNSFEALLNSNYSDVKDDKFIKYDKTMSSSFFLKRLQQQQLNHDDDVTFDDLNDDEFDRLSAATPSTEPMENIDMLSNPDESLFHDKTMNSIDSGNENKGNILSDNAGSCHSDMNNDFYGNDDIDFNEIWNSAAKLSNKDMKASTPRKKNSSFSSSDDDDTEDDKKEEEVVEEKPVPIPIVTSDTASEVVGLKKEENAEETEMTNEVKVEKVSKEVVENFKLEFQKDDELSKAPSDTSTTFKSTSPSISSSSPSSGAINSSKWDTLGNASFNCSSGTSGSELFHSPASSTMLVNKPQVIPPPVKIKVEEPKAVKIDDTNVVKAQSTSITVPPVSTPVEAPMHSLNFTLPSIPFISISTQQMNMHAAQKIFQTTNLSQMNQILQNSVSIINNGTPVVPNMTPMPSPVVNKTTSKKSPSSAQQSVAKNQKSITSTTTTTPVQMTPSTNTTLTTSNSGHQRWSSKCNVDSTVEGAIIGDVKTYVRGVIERVTAESYVDTNHTSKKAMNNTPPTTSGTLNCLGKNKPAETVPISSETSSTQAQLGAPINSNMIAIPGVNACITPISNSAGKASASSKVDESLKKKSKPSIVKKSQSEADPYEMNFDEKPSSIEKSKIPTVAVSSQKTEETVEPATSSIQRETKSVDNVIKDVVAGKFDVQSYLDSWRARPNASTSIPSAAQLPPMQPATLAQQNSKLPAPTVTASSDVIQKMSEIPNPSLSTPTNAATVTKSTTNNNIVTMIIDALKTLPGLQVHTVGNDVILSNSNNKANPTAVQSTGNILNSVLPINQMINVTGKDGISKLLPSTTISATTITLPVSAAAAGIENLKAAMIQQQNQLNKQNAQFQRPSSTPMNQPQQQTSAHAKHVDANNILNLLNNLNTTQNSNFQPVVNLSEKATPLASQPTQVASFGHLTNDNVEASHLEAKDNKNKRNNSQKKVQQSQAVSRLNTSSSAVNMKPQAASQSNGKSQPNLMPQDLQQQNLFNSLSDRLLMQDPANLNLMMNLLKSMVPASGNGTDKVENLTNEAILLHHLQSLIADSQSDFVPQNPLKSTSPITPALTKTPVPTSSVKTPTIPTSIASMRTPSNVAIVREEPKKPMQISKTEGDNKNENFFERIIHDYPFVWQGKLSLKNSEARVALHYIQGNIDLLNCCMKLLATLSNSFNSAMNSTGSAPNEMHDVPLRIVQRMRMEPAQLEAVQRKMSQDGASCACLALASGKNPEDLCHQTKILSDGFINYMQDKGAAGIINVCLPDQQQGQYVVHIFPPCDFSFKQLSVSAPALHQSVLNKEIPHLLVVITTV